jgi:hypothetical protein
MSDTRLPGRPALKLRPGQVPAFTADDMKAYLQGAPECLLRPTLSGESPTVESVVFASVKALMERLPVYIGPSNAWAPCASEWNELSAWVRSLNRAQICPAGNAPDNTRT